MKQNFVFLSLSLLMIAGCVDVYTPTPHPDYAIRVLPTPQGSVAIPPACPSWATVNADPYDNQPEPQYGCSQARNLALEIENPNDLIQGRTFAPQRGVTAVGAVRRYDNNQTRGLITPSAEVSQPAATTAPTANSAMTGDVTGGASGSSAASTGTAATP